MILAVDVGNSAVTAGLVATEEVGEVVVVPSGERLERLEGELGGLLTGRSGRLEGVCLCSVVPATTEVVLEACRTFADDVVVVDHATDTGLKLCYERPEELGADRLVNVYAAWRLHGPAAVVVDLGTATTVDVVDRDGIHRGGIIGVGLHTATKALHAMTALLPLVEPSEPETVVATSTRDALLSGTFWGAVGMIEGLVERATCEIGFRGTVVATGGWSELVGPHCRVIDTIDRWLTLKGLGLLWQRLRGRGC